MSETPKTSAQIELPPDLLAVTLVREGVNKHRARDIECWMNEKMTQAVEQATAELRAERGALRTALKSSVAVLSGSELSKSALIEALTAARAALKEAK